MRGQRLFQRCIGRVLFMGLLSLPLSSFAEVERQDSRQDSSAEVTPISQPQVIGQKQTRTRRSSSRQAPRASRSSTTRVRRDSGRNVYRGRSHSHRTNYRSSYGYGRSHYYYRGYRPYYYSFGFYGHYYPYIYWPGYYDPYFYWGRYGYYHYQANTGAIDLNVKPKKAAVYLDGHFIGKVGEFDGFPGYLRLKPGTYELIFYLEGHETVRKVYRVNSGIVLRERFRLAAGNAIAPEELSDPPVRPIAPKQETAESDHPRNHRRYVYVPEKDKQQPRSLSRSGDSRTRDRSTDLRGDPGQLTFSITPLDASVYLDGTFIGTGGDLSQGEASWLIDPGDHVLEVIHPSFKDSQTEFVIQQGENIHMNISLKSR